MSKKKSLFTKTIRQDMRNLGATAVAMNKAYKKCKESDEGHVYEDASFTNWKGEEHEQSRCVKCGVHFDIHLFHEQETKK